MDEAELKLRTKQFALRCIKLAESLPKTRTGDTIAGQLIRSSTSVGANYRAACRGRSRSEFLSKLGVVEEEADESAFWMELVVESGLKSAGLVEPLHDEATQLVRIVVSSINSARGGARSSVRSPQSKIRNS
jgi:four helix bundle protein